MMVVPAAKAEVPCERSCKSWNVELFPFRDSYSSMETRSQWLNRLAAMSENSPINYAFGPAGQLMAVSGRFPIASTSKRDLQKWLSSLKNELGVPAAATIVYQEARPFYEGTWETDGIAGTQVSFEVFLEGFVVGPREVTLILDSSGKFVRGLYNSFRPLAGAISFVRSVDEKTAWGIAASVTSQALSTRHSARLVLADLAELTQGVPAGNRLWWELKGEDALSYPRVFLIDARTGQVGYQVPERFNFDVPRTHYAHAWTQNPSGTPPNPLSTSGGTLWNSLSGACTSGFFCSGEGANESHLQLPSSSSFGRRENLATLIPRILNLWFVQSTNPGSVSQPTVLPAGFRCNPVSTCFQVPFPAPIDRSFDLKVSVRHAFPDRDDQALVATIGGDGWLTVAATKNVGDIIGHEYGHRMEALRSGLYGSTPDRSSPTSAWAVYDYNETMMDFYGHATEKFLDGSNNWKINEGELNWCPTVLSPYEPCIASGFPFLRTSDELTMQWDSEGGNCASVGPSRRKAFGRILYTPWLELQNQFGSSAINANYDFFFRAWFSEIGRTHYLATANFTKLIDFYAAAVARGNFTAPNGIGPRIQERMVSSLESALFSDWLPGVGPSPTGLYGAKCFQ